MLIFTQNYFLLLMTDCEDSSGDACESWPQLISNRNKKNIFDWSRPILGISLFSSDLRMAQKKIIVE